MSFIDAVTRGGRLYFGYGTKRDEFEASKQASIEELEDMSVKADIDIKRADLRYDAFEKKSIVDDRNDEIERKFVEKEQTCGFKFAYKGKSCNKTGSEADYQGSGMCKGHKNATVRREKEAMMKNLEMITMRKPTAVKKKTATRKTTYKPKTNTGRRKRAEKREEESKTRRQKDIERHRREAEERRRQEEQEEIDMRTLEHKHAELKRKLPSVPKRKLPYYLPEDEDYDDEDYSDDGGDDYEDMPGAGKVCTF